MMNAKTEIRAEFHPLVQQLITDHRNMLSLLDVLDNQVKHFILRVNDENIDINILLEAFYYIKVYPQRWHHPLEEQAFELLLNKDLREDDEHEIFIVQKQHQDLETETKEIERLFSLVAKDVIVPMNEITLRFYDFLDSQRKHIESENNWVFPIMIKNISCAEWDEIDNSLEAIKDPLFGGEMDTEFKELVKYFS